MSSTRTLDPHLSLRHHVWEWWKEHATQSGIGPTFHVFLRILWDFLRESTPARRKQRYGDVDFDWDYRVDTTSATVSWRDRFLGQFHSAYQPTEPCAFHEMLSGFDADFHEFTFIDLGSGKGRTLLMAADYPFRRILGVELLPSLHQVAQENIRKYHSDSQKCFALESVCCDARQFVFPLEPLVLYLFNPLPENALRTVIANLERSLQEYPRPVCVLYHNALLEHLLARSSRLRRVGGAEQYSVYATSSVDSAV